MTTSPSSSASAALVPALPGGEERALAAIQPLVERARAYAAERQADSTRRAYLRDAARFEVWCAEHGFPSAPATPACVAVYLAALADAGMRPCTIERALASIAWAHRSRGYPSPKTDPAVRAVMRGIRRVHGVAAVEQKAPVAGGELAALVATLDPNTLAAKRDRALLTLGWFGAFRRSELVALTVADVRHVPEGLAVAVRRSKRDQEGRGSEKGIARASDPNVCAVRALAAWLEAAQITEGPIFRRIDKHGHIGARPLGAASVALVVKRAAERAGLDPSRLAGHSLRAGFATTAAKNGKSLDAIMRQTHHRSERAARRYIRQQGLFDDNATVGLL